MHIETTCHFCEKDPAVFILPVREFAVPGFEDYPPRPRRLGHVRHVREADQR